MGKILLLVFALLWPVFSAQALSLTPAQQEKVPGIAQSSYWRRLLHYQKTLLGGEKSTVDGGAFFFSPDGAKDPQAELLAFVEALGSDRKIGKLAQTISCAFPERTRFLQKELGLTLAPSSCPKLEAYLQQFNAASVTLVFSSAYPSNPGSMFGHTFLRINAKQGSDPKKRAKLDLLDYGISYAANVGDDQDSGIKFAWNGLMGGYIGQFSSLPYYAKVNEYNNSESRDLWEYELNLNEEETLRLLRNAWEVETNSYSEYFFFDENCAYQLLTLLEVAKPEWTISDFAIYVIPAETVKRVAQVPGAVKGIRFRPSARKKMLSRFGVLEKREKAEFSSALATGIVPSSPAVLDALITRSFYIKQKSKPEISPEEEKLLSNYLIARSKIAVPERPGAPLDESSRPDLSHNSYRVGLGSGIATGQRTNDKLAFAELYLKVAYHDLLNSDLGYTPFSEINFPSIRLRTVPKEKNFIVEEFEAFSIVALNPFSQLEKPLSWKFLLTYYQPKDLVNCNYCHLAHIETGAGASLLSKDEKVVFFALALAELEAGSELTKGYRGGPKLIISSLWNPVQKYKVQLAHSTQTDLFQSQRQKVFFLWELKNSYALKQNLDLRLEFSYLQKNRNDARDSQGMRVQSNFYF